ncbi:MAG: hypothetical protein ACLFQB_05765 [Chitinispirillaceae bacterium]
MKNITSQQDLYIKLASEGDPSAFHSLFHKHFESQYTSLRAEGQDHSRACEAVFTKAAALYRKFIGKNVTDAEDWFSSQEKNSDDFELPPKEDFSFSQDELAAFRHELQLVLQRTYSSLLRKGSSRNTNGRLKKRNYSGMIACSAAAVLLISAVAALFVSDFTLTLSLMREGKEYRFSVPGGVEKRVKESTVQKVPEKKEKAEIEKADTTEEKKAAVSKPAPQKKKSVRNVSRRPSVSSSKPKPRPKKTAAAPVKPKPRRVSKPEAVKQPPSPKKSQPKPKPEPKSEPAAVNSDSQAVSEPVTESSAEQKSAMPGAKSDEKKAPEASSVSSQSEVGEKKESSATDIDDLLDMPGMRKAPSDSQ